MCGFGNFWVVLRMLGPGLDPPLNGTLSFDEFRAAAGLLVDKWATVINPDLPPWSWIPHSDVATASFSSHDDKEQENLSCRGYLALDNLCTFKPNQDQGANIAVEECCFTDTDAASLVGQHDLTLHCYDLHIVYSDSFRVPVLYFRAYTNDGSPLCMDDIEKDLPPIYAKQLPDSKWTFITQEEHPYLNRPWYKLHPCGTGEWMKLLYDTDASLMDRNRIGTELYLLLWLSVVGPMIGFKIPIEARKQMIGEALASNS